MASPLSVTSSYSYRIFDLESENLKRSTDFKSAVNVSFYLIKSLHFSQIASGNLLPDASSSILINYSYSIETSFTYFND